MAQMVKTLLQYRIPGSGRSAGEGHGSPLQYSCLEDSVDRGAWWATVMGLQSQALLSNSHAHVVTKSCPTLCDPIDYSLPGSSVHGIVQARVLEWVAISFSRGASQLKNRTQVSCTAGRFFTI